MTEQAETPPAPAAEIPAAAVAKTPAAAVTKAPAAPAAEAAPEAAAPATPDPLSAEEAARLEALQERIAVRFRRPELLREAMTHASWNNERGEVSGPGRDYERLEYLGDAVLELAVGEYLFKTFPGYDEGQLTQLRATLVNTTSLARLARNLGLGETLLVGRGAAKQGVNELPSLLADAFEAMIGAVFLDQGFRVAVRVFLQNMGDLADWADENYKGKLQEIAQERLGATPHYRVAPSGGPGHHRVYDADAVVAGDVVGHGSGSTKQAAEQAAAHAALDRLATLPEPPARAAGAARQAARRAAGQPARVRRRMMEAAAERGAGKDSRPPKATEKGSRRGLLGTLRAAAEALVGRREEPAPEPPPKKRSRRGHRGGRGRGRSRPAAQ